MIVLEVTVILANLSSFCLVVIAQVSLAVEGFMGGGREGSEKPEVQHLLERVSSV